MVSPVDPSGTVARLAALVRQGSADAAATRQGPTRRRSAEDDLRASTQAGLATILRTRLRAAGDDPVRRQRAASRLLVEVLLSDEFGVGLSAEGGFPALVDDVVDAMDSSPQLRVDLDRWVARLLSVDPDPWRGLDVDDPP